MSWQLVMESDGEGFQAGRRERRKREREGGGGVMVEGEQKSSANSHKDNLQFWMNKLSQCKI